MEDDAQRVAFAAMQSADTVAQGRPIEAARAANRPMIDGDDDSVTLAQRYNFRTSWLSRIALRQQELATLEIHAGLIEQDHNLEWKYVFTVQILMQTAIVAGLVMQEQRRWLLLTGTTTDIAKLVKRRRKAFVDAHRAMPAIGHRRKAWVKRLTQLANEVRQRLGKVFVFSAAKSVPLHHDVTTKTTVLREVTRDLVTFPGGKQGG